VTFARGLIAVWVLLSQKSGSTRVEPPRSKVSGANFNGRHRAEKSYQLASSGTTAATANHLKRREATSGRIAGI